MPTFRIEQYELHMQTYQVEAESEAHAIVKVLDGEAEAIDNGLEYIEVCDDCGLPVEHFKNLAEQLHDLGIPMNEDIIPTIRSIEQVN